MLVGVVGDLFHLLSLNLLFRRFPLLHPSTKQSMTMQQQQEKQFVPVSSADVKNARWGPALSDLADASSSSSSTSSSSSSSASTAAEFQRASNPPPGPPDLLLRLSSVPVYAVVNKKDEFVLVTGGEMGKDGTVVEKELGLLFLSEAGARALADKVIKEGGKKLAKSKGDVVVARTTLDRVYSLAAAAVRPKGAEDVIFRFVPSAKEVSRAVALVREGVAAATTSSSNSSSSSAAAAAAASVETAVPGFAGVPVFQAAGLSVSSEARRYTPLFLDSGDLDEAVRGAADARDAAAAAAEAEDAAVALRAAQARLDSIPAAENGGTKDKDQKRRKQAEEALEQASARAARAGERGVVKGAGGPPPPVEVGCLEAVLAEMAGERSEGGPWSQAMIVPPGALAARAAAAAARAKQQQQQTGKKK